MSSGAKSLQTPRWVWAAGCLLVVGCLLCGTGLAARQAVTRPGSMPAHVCAGVQLAPFPRAGVTWILPIMSSLPPYVWHSQVCALVPWASWLPPRGGLAFPP